MQRPLARARGTSRRDAWYCLEESGDAVTSEGLVLGLKGWLTGGGGVASMAAAVTGKGLEGPEEGVGKR